MFVWKYTADAEPTGQSSSITIRSPGGTTDLHLVEKMGLILLVDLLEKFLTITDVYNTDLFSATEERESSWSFCTVHFNSSKGYCEVTNIDLSTLEHNIKHKI